MEGELSPATVAGIMKSAGFATTRVFPEPSPVPDIPVRPPILCAGCMHRATFYAIRKVFRDGVFPSDIGCYTLGLQLGAVDTTICMGASITVASGIFSFRRKTGYCLHNRRFYISPHGNPGTSQCSIQQGNNDCRYSRQQDNGNDRAPAEPLQRVRCLRVSHTSRFTRGDLSCLRCIIRGNDRPS